MPMFIVLIQEVEGDQKIMGEPPRFGRIQKFFDFLVSIVLRQPHFLFFPFVLDRDHDVRHVQQPEIEQILLAEFALYLSVVTPDGSAGALESVYDVNEAQVAGFAGG